MMKISKKILIISMLVMMICCVSAVSATDINSTDNTVTDDIAVDEVSDIVEEVEIDDAGDGVVDEEIDDASDDVDEQENLRLITPTINSNTNIYNFFDGYGNLKSNVGNTFTFYGDFYNNAYSFDNFKINRAVTINANGATFYDMGFELSGGAITLNGATFVMNAPEDEDCILIDVSNAQDTVISNNVITYTCNYNNLDNTNYVIRAKESDGVTITGNTIVAYLPLKDVDYETRTGMDMDLAAVIGVEYCDEFQITYNDIKANVSTVDGDYPTLDAIIVLDSWGAYIGHNNVTEIDDVTQPGSANYLYAIDVYRCDDLTIEYNNIKLVSSGGTFIEGTDNGTSTAYGIQLTGGYEGVIISHNNITTSNNGPNAGIYSQNFGGDTQLSITDNIIHVEGNASSHSWSLVTGMELQDNDVYVARNVITVINKCPYNIGDNAYGISFSQYGNANPTFEITNNTVDVVNGMYAVYIQYSTSVSSTYENCLHTTYNC